MNEDGGGRREDVASATLFGILIDTNNEKINGKYDLLKTIHRRYNSMYMYCLQFL